MIYKFRYKLFDRQGQCYINLQKVEEAKKSFEQATKELQKTKLDNQTRLTLASGFQHEMEQCVRDESQPIIDTESAKEPSLTGKRNKKYTQLAKSVDVLYTPEKGRHIVAKRDLLPGEVVMIEKPFASVVLPEKYGTHCHRCFARCFSMVPCDGCAMARYCGDNCKQAAWSSFHHYECSILGILHGSGVGKFGHLALRTVLKIGAKKMLEMKKHVEEANADKNPENLGCSGGRYKEDDYNAIFNLVTHSKDRMPSDLFKRGSMAAFLLKCIDATVFFSEVEEDDRATLREFVGGCLLSHLQAYPCNAHEISELELDSSSVPTASPAEIGAGIYATLSLFNHSCDPAVTRNFYKDTCVVRTIRGVKQGEEVPDNYGAHYAVSPRSERQNQLKMQYLFECGCEACTHDWPLYQQLPSHTPLWRCQECQAPLQVILHPYTASLCLV